MNKKVRLDECMCVNVMNKTNITADGNFRYEN